MTPDKAAARIFEQLRSAIGDRYDIDTTPMIGGMAAVFRAVERRHQRPVAIKVLRPDALEGGDADRFAREIATVAGLEHPHILRLIDSGSADGLPYFVMPFIEGGTLRQRLDRDGQLPVAEALKIAEQVGEGLGLAHRLGVIHRDVKPENIFLLDGNALIGDFGISLPKGTDDHRLTQTGHALGTIHYMSPEQATGEPDLDARTDVFALGAVLYEMLAGEPPFPGNTRQAVFNRMMTQDPPALPAIRPGVAKGVDAAIRRALARDPDDRYASATEFIQALHAGETVSRRSVDRKFVVGGVIGAAIAVAAIVMLGTRSPVETATEPMSAASQVTFDGNVSHVALSPNERLVAYLVDQGRSLMVQEMDREGSRRVLTSETPMGPARFSADGRVLLVHATLGGASGLYRVPVLGGDAMPVPAPPVGRPGRDGRAGDSARASEPPPATQRTDVGGGQDSMPAPTPGAGGPLAGGPQPGRPAASGRGGGVADAYDLVASDSIVAIVCCGRRIYVGPDPSSVVVAGRDSVTVGRGKLFDVASTLGSIYDLKAAPNGRRIAITGLDQDGYVVVADLDLGSGAIAVIQRSAGAWRGDPGNRSSVRWGPSGNSLWFSRETNGGSEIVRLPVSGKSTGPAEVVVAGLSSPLSFDVGQRRGQLVFATGPTRTRMLAYDLATRTTSTLFMSTATYHSPRIAPRSGTIAFVKGRGRDQDIYAWSPADSSERRLTTAGLPIGGLSWSPDGARIAFTTVGDTVTVSVVDFASRRITAVATDASPPTTPQWSGSSAVVFESAAGELVSVDLLTGLRATMDLDRAGPTPGPGRAARPPIGPFVVGPAGDVAYATFGPRGRVSISSAAGARTVSEDFRMPLSWASDTSLLLTESGRRGADSTLIERLNPRSGRWSVYARLPFSCSAGDLGVAPDLSRVACFTRETTSDVWMQEPSKGS